MGVPAIKWDRGRDARTSSIMVKGKVDKVEDRGQSNNNNKKKRQAGGMRGRKEGDN